MRKRILKYSIWIVVLLFGVGLYSLNADYLAYTSSLPELELPAQQTAQKNRLPSA